MNVGRCSSYPSSYLFLLKLNMNMNMTSLAFQTGRSRNTARGGLGGAGGHGGRADGRQQGPRRDGHGHAVHGGGDAQAVAHPAHVLQAQRLHHCFPGVPMSLLRCFQGLLLRPKVPPICSSQDPIRFLGEVRNTPTLVPASHVHAGC